MKSYIIRVILLLCFWTLESKGCHPREQPTTIDIGENSDITINEDGAALTRKKRQIIQVPYPENLELQEFFSFCMQSYWRFGIVDIPTIVRFSIGQTTWFEGSDQVFCSSDTVSCWQSILYSYMDQNSELFIPAMMCIRQYGQYRGQQPVFPLPMRPHYFYPIPRRRVKRQASNLPIDENEAAIQLQQSLPGYRGDFRSLIRFFQDDAICSPAFCNCNGVVIPQGETCGSNWYTKLGAMTRASSPIRAPLLFALNSITAEAARRQEEQNRQNQQSLLQTILISQVLRRRQSQPPSPVAETATEAPRVNIITTIIYVTIAG